MSSQWLLFAISSGACAALNGTFAKLTTTSLTSSIASSLAALLSLPDSWSRAFELLVRAAFFALNLAFDALMWGLFTRALTLARSTVHVSVLNTSTNFMVAAAAGWVVFGEKLPGLWWVGAAMLMVGCALVAGREENETKEERDELLGRIGAEEEGRGSEEQELSSDEEGRGGYG